MTKQYFAYIIVILILGGGGWLLFKNKGESGNVLQTSPSMSSSPSMTPEAAIIELSGGLKYQDQVVGQGKEAKAGDLATVHYVGVLADGRKFDSSRDRGTPFSFTLGAGEVIKGWDLGVAGMREGGKRVLLIPPELGYGARGAGGGAIPPNATLLFEVELLKVEKS